MIERFLQCSEARAETWRRIWGGTKQIFRGPISGKISIFRVKISDDLLFLVIDLVLRIFSFFSHIFRMFTMLNVVYDHFLKPPFPQTTIFHSVLTFTHIRQHYFSKYWGDQCMGRPLTSNWGR